jgi:hypothetical protein
MPALSFIPQMLSALLLRAIPNRTVVSAFSMLRDHLALYSLPAFAVDATRACGPAVAKARNKVAFGLTKRMGYR